MNLSSCAFCFHLFRILRLQVLGLSHRELSFPCRLLTKLISSSGLHKVSRLPLLLHLLSEQKPTAPRRLIRTFLLFVRSTVVRSSPTSRHASGMHFGVSL